VIVSVCALQYGCVNVPPTADLDLSESSVSVIEQPLAKPLDAETVYDYLLADIAARRGEVDASLAAVARLASRTRDLPLVVRAFRLALHVQDGATAEQMAELLSEIQTDPLRSSFAVIQAYMIQDKADQVVALISQLLKDYPTDRTTIFGNIAEVYISQEHPEDFVDDLNLLIAEFPTESRAYYAMAFLANRIKDSELLGKSINRALQLDPHWQQAAQVKFNWLVDVGKIEDATKFAKNFLTSHADANGLREGYARQLATQGQLAEAYQQFREFLLQEPDNEDVSLSHALIGIELERYSRSRRTLLSLLKLHPENDQLRIYLGQLELRRSRSEEAIYWFSEVRDDALFFDAQIQIATAVANLEGSEAALDFLSELIPLTTNEQVSLYLTREGFLRDLGDLEIVLELLDAAIQDIPDNGKLLYSRAILFAELDQIAQHEADMRRVIELDPDNAHAFNALGYTLADQTTRYDEALELILRALELSPNDPFILDSMGWIHFRLGQLERAEKFLRQAHNVRTDAEIAAHLGEVLWQRGAKEEAELIWQSGVSLEPENKTLLETMERLRK